LSCPICETIRAEGSPLGTIAELPTGWVTAGNSDPPVPGYVCVVSRRHVEEPFELDETESAAYWADVMRTARALAAVTRPRKLNYEIHGNTIPHLHVHLFPRHASGTTEPAQLASELQAALR
jgi:diadenosine tetraphosphate (Ap4A) HIT family hydrolase